jgi:predicted DNA-binding protein
MMKRTQVTFGNKEAKRLKALAKTRGIPFATLIRELAMRNLKEVEQFWGIRHGRRV